LANEFVIAVEDKTNTELHSGNDHGVEKLGTNYPGKRVLPIFLKSGDQAGYDNVASKGFKPFLRADLLAILRPPPSISRFLKLLPRFTLSGLTAAGS
jgi:hypothetical protein